MNVRIKIDPLIALFAHSYIIMIYQTMILQKNIPASTSNSNLRVVFK